MSTTRASRQLLETREQAIIVVKELIRGNSTRFELVPFEKYNTIAKLRSQHYNGYFVVCHVNTLRSAGWLVCRYAKNGDCPLDRAIQIFKTVQGGTPRLERHTKSHRNGSTAVCFQRQLPISAKKKVALAAALAVCVDVRPLSFCDGHPEMKDFAQSIFEMGQSVPENEKIDPKSYLPGRTAVTSAVKELSEQLRSNFTSEVQNGLLEYGGAATIDGVHLKVQGKHYFDFTLHFMDIQEKGRFSKVEFKIRNVTLLVTEAPDHPNAKNIRQCINAALVHKYGTTMDFFTKGFTMVTDSAAIITKVAGASVSRDLHCPDETWMGCLAHMLNNTMKFVIANRCTNDVLGIVLQDFRSMKKIIEDSNRAGWNHLLPEGCRLIQESETRFGTYYQVAERFLKASLYISDIVKSHLGRSARSAYDSLKKTSNIDGTITGYPGVEAIFDGFGVVVNCIEKLETSTRPTLQVALPLIYLMISSLDNITKGNKVWRGENQALALPSIYSRELCCAIRDKLHQMAWDHPLLLVGCYLNPLFREMEFIHNPTMRVEYRSKAEDFDRKLTRKHKERTVIFNMEDEPITINDSDGEKLAMKLPKMVPHMPVPEQEISAERKDHSIYFHVSTL